MVKVRHKIGWLLVALVAATCAAASASQPVDISIRFNGGGSHNKVYVGRDNIMEIMIRNDVLVLGISLGFHFSSASGPFSWATPFGTKPTLNPVFLPSDDLARSFDLTEGLVSTTALLPDSMLIAGVALDSNTAFPIHSQPTVFCSMKLRIPADQSAATLGFCVDNMFFPPAGGWEVVTLPDYQEFSPTFNGQENTSRYAADAPPMCFDIAVQPFIRGDLDDNMTIDPADIVRWLQYTFLDGPAPAHPESADVNADGRVNIADVMFLIRYIFMGGPEPAW